MKTLAITQRVDVSPTGERRDALDQRWCSLLESLGARLLLVPNSVSHAMSFFFDLRIEGIILSGGNDIADIPGAKNAAPERDRVERELIAHATQKNLPLLGVCRGLQMLAHYYRTPLITITGHVAVRHSVQAKTDFFPAEPVEVNSFHNYGIAGPALQPPLQVLATDVRGNVEALRHQTLPQYGIMWHPEREDAWQPHDLKLLRQIFKL